MINVNTPLLESQLSDRRPFRIDCEIKYRIWWVWISRLIWSHD